VHRGKRGEAANIAAAAKAGGIPSTLKISTKLGPVGVRGQIAKGSAMKADIQNASYLAGVSTASMGKFDQRLKGEKGDRKLPGLRKKHLPAVGALREGEILSKVARKVARCADQHVSSRLKAQSHTGCGCLW
jgi:regulator of ribosome biosynthesis